MPNQFVPAALLGLLAVGGCAQIGGAPIIVGSHASVPERMMAIASRFEQDRRQGGMSGVIGGIGQCYASAANLVIEIYAVRDCLVLDYAAYWTDMKVGRRLNGGRPLPFFEDRTATERWARYAPLAQFDTPQRMLNYLKDSNTLVQMDLAQINAGPVLGNRPLFPHLATHL